MHEERFIAIGRIRGAHGVKGALKIEPYNPDSPLFKKGQQVYIDQKEGMTPAIFTFIADRSKGLRAEFDIITDRDEANAVIGKEIFVKRKDFKPLAKGEHYVVDLIGLSVLDESGEELYGTLKEVMETGANDCYVVKKGKRELLIPATKEVILSVDLTAKEIRVKLPEGLLEIYEV